MALVNNATGVYATLGFNFSDPSITNFPANTVTHMESLPPIISTWQAQDIANNEVGGYFINPVSNSIHWMSDTANTLLSYSPIRGSNDTITGYFTDILANCAYLSIGNSTYTPNSQSFLYHTDRLSNIRFQTDDAFVKIDGTNLPYYQTAIQAGKSATYITNQTDGIANNSVMLGSFTSILVANQINALANTLYHDANTIIQSLTAEGGGEGGEPTYYMSSLSQSVVLQYSNDFANVVILMTERESSDLAFYANLKNLITNYNTTKQLTNLGDSQSYLVNNFIGTPKAITRINS